MHNEKYVISGDAVAVIIYNVRSLRRHAYDTVSANLIIDNNITGFTETQIKPSDSSIKIIETFHVFNIDFINIKMIFKFS